MYGWPYSDIRQVINVTSHFVPFIYSLCEARTGWQRVPIPIRDSRQIKDMADKPVSDVYAIKGRKLAANFAIAGEERNDEGLDVVKYLLKQRRSDRVSI